MNPILIVGIAAGLLGIWGYAGKNRRDSEAESSCQSPPHCCHQPHCPTPEEKFEVELNCQADPDYEVVWECSEEYSCDEEGDCGDLDAFCDEECDGDENKDQDQREP